MTKKKEAAPEVKAPAVEFDIHTMREAVDAAQRELVKVQNLEAIAKGGAMLLGMAGQLDSMQAQLKAAEDARDLAQAAARSAAAQVEASQTAADEKMAQAKERADALIAEAAAQAKAELDAAKEKAASIRDNAEADANKAIGALRDVQASLQREVDQLREEIASLSAAKSKAADDADAMERKLNSFVARAKALGEAAKG